MSEQETANLPDVNLVSNSLNELTEETDTPPVLKSMGNLSMARQMGLMLGLALSVAVGIAVVLWSQSTPYDVLYAGMGEQDFAEMIDVMDKMEMDYKIEPGSGAIMVPSDQIRELKLKLAAQGLPRTQSSGYELLDKETSFGTSKNIELMRFQRALEGEIARTIMVIQNVKSARVLLALPKQSVFVRKRKEPSASVIVNLYRGRVLEKNQIESIIHLVSSSVPMMAASKVTVVDQKGRMLSGNSSSDSLNLTSKQFEYKKNLEDHLMQRVENILLPLLGSEGMQAQVSADVDFSVTEKTQEQFNPDLPALRSEQIMDEESSLSSIQGVPGALSNQPPPAGVAPELAVGEDANAAANTPTSKSKSATRNFELDKTITHTRLSTGILRRLSVAVVIDDKQVVLDDGSVTTQPYAQEDINQLRSLVMQAVGYDNSRGDLVTVTNVAFRTPDTMEALPALPIWQQAWFLELAKYLAAALAVLFIIFGVLRPTMRGLISRDEEVKALIDAHAEAEAMGGTVRIGKDGKPIAVPVEGDEESEAGEAGISAGAEDLLLLEAPQSYEKRLEYVQKLIDEDPQLVSQLIKGWVATSG